VKQLEMKHKKMTMFRGSGPREEYRRAAAIYSEEKVGYFEQVLGQPLDY
jgi:hypothetical protein